MYLLHSYAIKNYNLNLMWIKQWFLKDVNIMDSTT